MKYLIQYERTSPEDRSVVLPDDAIPVAIHRLLGAFEIVYLVPTKEIEDASDGSDLSGRDENDIGSVPAKVSDGRPVSKSRDAKARRRK